MSSNLNIDGPLAQNIDGPLAQWFVSKSAFSSFLLQTTDDINSKLSPALVDIVVDFLQNQEFLYFGVKQWKELNLRVNKPQSELVDRVEEYLQLHKNSTLFNGPILSHFMLVYIPKEGFYETNKTSKEQSETEEKEQSETEELETLKKITITFETMAELRNNKYSNADTDYANYTCSDSLSNQHLVSSFLNKTDKSHFTLMSLDLVPQSKEQAISKSRDLIKNSKEQCEVTSPQDFAICHLARFILTGQFDSLNTITSENIIDRTVCVSTWREENDEDHYSNFYHLWRDFQHDAGVVAMKRFYENPSN